ncbi:MAG: heme biosynthesis HemY N-terminal domain-containing protein [Gammaproteobacteria bacterium]
MTTLVAFIVAVIAAAVVGLLLSHEQSYVLVSYGTTRIEFTLFTFIVIYILALAVGGVLIAIIRRIARAPARFDRARESRATRRSERMLTTGLTALAEGRLAPAERALDRAAHGPLLVPALLAAARAAEAGGARDRRDEYLRRVREARPEAAHAALLTQAELDLEAGNYGRVLDALKPLHGGRTTHPMVLRGLARAYAALGEHRAVLDLLDELERNTTMPRAELEALAAAALSGALAQGQEAPAGLWQRIPRDLRRRPALLRIAARANSRVGASGRAAELLEHALSAEFDAPSVCAYSALTDLPAATRLHRLETWLERYPEEPVLLREAGRVALELKLWGQARNYLDHARQRGPDPAADLLAGLVAEQEGHQAEALTAYRNGLETVAQPTVRGGPA